MNTKPISKQEKALRKKIFKEFASKGGKAAAASMTKEQRSNRAIRAAMARWNKNKKK